jgi:isopenicillin-N N-acyltransferase like protein
MRLRPAASFCIIAALLAGCMSAPQAAPTAVPVVVPAPVSIPIAQFRGDPTQIGTQHGVRFRQQINDLHQNFLLKQLQGSQLVEARLAAAEFELYMLPEHRAEVQALSAASGVDVYDSLLAQCFLDLTPQAGCSTISLPAGASPDGIARFGRNLDFPSLAVLDSRSVLMIYHPAGRYAFAAIGWPGMVGLVSGMNEYGLCVASMEVPRGFRPPMAMPYTLLYRAILEQCRTVNEAIDFLKRTPRQTANNLMLMDAAGDRAVAEIRPEGVTVRRAADSIALISTNHQRGQDANKPGLCWRYDSLHAASADNFGRNDRGTLERMLGNVVQGENGDMTIQSMIFEPANCILYLATGLDAPSRPYARIDLKPYFRGLIN